MKAKRVLSLLLTVAMVATIVSAFGMTAFAAPEGYEDYVKTAVTQPKGEELGQPITAGAVRPTDNVIGEYTITKITDAEALEILSAYVSAVAGETFVEESYTQYEEDMALEPGSVSVWAGKAYTVKLSLSNIGTLVKSGAASKSGYVIDGIFDSLKADKPFYYATLASSDVDPKLTARDTSGMKDSYSFTFNWLVSAIASCYPLSNGTYADAAVDNVYTALIFADEGTVLTPGGVTADCAITMSNWKANKMTDTNGTGYSKDTYAYWHPATITLGTATEPEKEPVIDNVVTGDTSGVEIINGDRTGKKYDNAFATSASFSNAGSITGAGVLFIPEVVLGSNELTVETATVANAYKEGAFLGEGAYTIKAAIRNIPAGLAGTDIKMVVRPYILKDDAYTYGTAATATVNFTVTGE